MACIPENFTCAVLSYLFSSILPCEAASGSGELGNNIDADNLFSLEANEMKTGISPIPIMPSPIFLWRFKVGTLNINVRHTDKHILRYASFFLSNNVFDEEQNDVMLSMSMLVGDVLTFVILSFPFVFQETKVMSPVFTRIDLKNCPS